jgi:predicted ATPase
MRQMLCPQLIGRDDEVQAMQAALHAARHASGGSVFLLGEAGVGKSRLAREAERLALSDGMRVLWGRSVEDGGAVAFRPLTEALMSSLRRDSAVLADHADLRPFLPSLGRLIPDVREHGVVPASADDSPVLLSEAVLRVLRALGSPDGCLLVLEDLHWSDPETLAVLDYLTANVSGEPVLVLATSRPETSSRAVALARALVAHRTGTVFDLPRLRPSDVREMASACLHNAPVPESVERLLSTSAEGLPLLVEDLLAEWVSAGALARVQVQGSAGWEVRRGIAPVVPMSFADTVRRRLQVLGAECTRVLEVAATLGRDFDWTLLPSASGLDEERVLDDLHAAVDAQLLEAEPGGFRFRHALTREAVLHGLSPVQRARQAGRLLALVKAAHPQLESEWCELAAALAESA